MTLVIGWKPAELVWTDMMWLYIETPHNQRYVGEAGNPSYNDKNQLSAMKVGDQVLIQGARTKTGTQTMIIGVDTIVSGFGEELEGRTLGEILVDGVHYMYDLKRAI